MSEFPIVPLPRWTVLPGDPAPLRAWLRDQAAKDAPPTDQAGLPPVPDDEDGWRAAS